MKQAIIFSFIIGALTTVLGYQMYINFQFRKSFNSDHATLAQVVQFLNENISNSQKK